MKVDKNLVSGSTTMLVLSLLEREDMYGYQMIECLESRSENIFTLKAGTLYPLLHSLEKQGVIASYDEEGAGGRPRKYYSLTGAGRKLLNEKKNEWRVYSSAVERVIEGGLSFGYQ